MKQTIFLIALSSLCVTAVAQKHIKYEFPEAMPEHVKSDYLEQCKKGKILYDINCAKCHNTTVKRKEIIPDFTVAQLINYELRVQNPKHTTNIPENTVNTEELGLIITFLTYKKKN
jgi:hypothetical protein